MNAPGLLMARSLLLLVAVLLPGSIGCLFPLPASVDALLPATEMAPPEFLPEPMDLAGDETEIRDRILERVPIGTPVMDALAIMSNKGFDCSLPDLSGQRTAPYFCFSATRSAGWLVDRKVWGRMYYDDSNRIIDVRCRAIPANSQFHGKLLGPGAQDR